MGDTRTMDAAIRARLEEMAQRARDEMTAEIERLQRERDALRAIIEGRAVAPTDEEIAAHHAADGEWLGFWADGSPWQRGAVVVSFTYSEEHECAARRCVRWWPLDRDGRPCAWPVAEVTP